MMVKVGNVGPYLLDTLSCHTFLTLDGGHSWRQILRGPYQHAFADQGGILLLVRDDGLPTDTLLYSLDHGRSFVQFPFLSTLSVLAPNTDDGKVFVRKLITRLRGVGTSVLIVAEPTLSALVTTAVPKQWLIRVDFAGHDFPTCILDLNDEDNDDFERWSLARLEQDASKRTQKKQRQLEAGNDDAGTVDNDQPEAGCLFGRKVKYLRRISDRQCFYGRDFDPRPHHELDQHCVCSRADFECDFNFEPLFLQPPSPPPSNSSSKAQSQPTSSFKCVHVGPTRAQSPASEPAPVPQDCLAGQEFYYESTGYRKMAISSCVGEHPLLGNQKPCLLYGTPPTNSLARLGLSWIAILSVSGILGWLTFHVIRRKAVSSSEPPSPDAIHLHGANSFRPQIKTTSTFASLEQLPKTLKGSLEAGMGHLQWAWELIVRAVLPPNARHRLNRNLYQTLDSEQARTEDATMLDEYVD